MGCGAGVDLGGFGAAYASATGLMDTLEIFQHSIWLQGWTASVIDGSGVKVSATANYSEWMETMNLSVQELAGK